MTVADKISELRVYASNKAPIVQQFIEDWIAAELTELNDLLDHRDRYVKRRINHADRI